MIARPHEVSPVLPCCLVVDDEPRLRQAMVHLMRADGFQCVEAANGVEALEQLERYPVSLMLSDLRMPKMDGLELLRESRVRFPDVAVVMITAVADVQVAVSCLANGAADYVVKEQARENEELFLASIQSLAEALELKDPYTRGHSIRVSQYSRAIARVMGLYGDVLRQIELGGHVHDIGKIGVREAVLNKAERLTAEEYEHIMTHPVLGWRILAPLLGDRPCALSIVRSHHERYDGLGTPDGLHGNLIPLEARIVAV